MKLKTRLMKAQAQTIVAGVLGDARTSGCTLDIKVLKEDILYHAPGRYFQRCLVISKSEFEPGFAYHPPPLGRYSLSYESCGTNSPTQVLIYAELCISSLLVSMFASFTTTFTTELSSRYWPRLPIATPLPPCTVIYEENIMLAVQAIWVHPLLGDVHSG